MLVGVFPRPKWAVSRNPLLLEARFPMKFTWWCKGVAKVVVILFCSRLGFQWWPSAWAPSRRPGRNPLLLEARFPMGTGTWRGRVSRRGRNPLLLEARFPMRARGKRRAGDPAVVILFCSRLGFQCVSCILGPGPDGPVVILFCSRLGFQFVQNGLPLYVNASRNPLLLEARFPMRKHANAFSIRTSRNPLLLEARFPIGSPSASCRMGSRS